MGMKIKCPSCKKEQDFNPFYRFDIDDFEYPNETHPHIECEFCNVSLEFQVDIDINVYEK